MWIVPWDPFLMKILTKKKVCESYEQCTWPTRSALALLKHASQKNVCIWIVLKSTILRMHLCFPFSFFFEVHFNRILVFLVGPMHCLQDPQISFFNKNFIKNRSHSTIYIFKNYFVIIFSKISDIQTYLICKLHVLEVERIVHIRIFLCPYFSKRKFFFLPSKNWSGSHSRCHAREAHLNVN